MIRRSLHFVMLGVVVVAGCRPRPAAQLPPAAYTEALFAAKRTPLFTLKVDARGRPVDTVVGEPRRYVIREGDTLLDVARLHDLGYNEIVEANPGVDPWLPPIGKTIVLPTQWVLPCCTYAGLVVNIPEMRLYYYRQGMEGRLALRTYPLGLGRTDRRTPRGRFAVIGKTVDPTWVIPEPIRREHEQERGDARRSIPGGAPDNPLGKYRIELSLRPYSIHGTNIAWGVGMEVSHGCARLYPEDIERLFPMVEKGTPGEFLYQPVKVGRRGGITYVEAHPDIYKLGASSPRKIADALARAGTPGPPSPEQLVTALAESRGMPYRIGSPARHATGP